MNFLRDSLGILLDFLSVSRNLAITTHTINPMSDDSFQNLSSKVDDLIDLCAEMKRENQTLKAKESSLKSEHEKMVQRNQEAKSKLQSVLERLKAMDNS